MTALTDVLAFPDLRRVVLLEVTSGEHLKFWTLTAGKTYTYEAMTTNRVTWVKENGAYLYLRSGIDAVEAEDGTWFWNQSAGKVYIHPTGDASPYTKTIQAIVFFPFATEGRVINGIYYEGRILSLPSLSMRIENKFGSPGQIGSGNVELNNDDGFFDTLTGLQWDAGEAVLKLGADEAVIPSDTGGSATDGVYTDSDYDGAVTDPALDGAQAEVGGTSTAVDYSGYDKVGVWRVTEWSKDDGTFTLTLEEKKGTLKKKIPLGFYSRADYTNMEENSVGDAIPISYGTVYDVRPVCIDIAARRFKCAGHPIKELLGCRVQDASKGSNKGAWNDVNFETQDEWNGEFTLAAIDWDGTAEVAVDFRGRMNGDGTLMDNASDIVRDILTVWLQEPPETINDAVFAQAWERLNIGYNSDGFPVTRTAIALHIFKEEDADKLISRINACAGSYLFNDFSGLYQFVVFEPSPGAALPTLEEADIKSIEEVIDATEIYSSVKAGYQYRAKQDYPQRYIFDRPEAQYLQGARTAVLLDLENIPVDALADARYVAQRYARMDGERKKTYKAKLSHRAWPLMPGDMIRVVYARQGIDAVFEILERKVNLSSTTWIDFVLGDLHGLGDGILFATADSPVFPDSLGGGSASAWDDDWTDAQKAWTRQNVGYVTDDNGFSSATDPDSYMAGITV